MIRTYYWNTRKASLKGYIKNRIFNPNKVVFRYGNAGDIFNADLIEYLYGEKPNNILEEGNRLLLVGSIMSVIKKGDIINGIGWKGNDLKEKKDIIESAKVYGGVRGPLTKSLFEKYGADLSNLKFEFDPGLLIRDVYNIDVKKSKERQVLFIPHFRDLWIYKDYPKGVKVISIDNKPETIIKEILKSSVVYASSLHGIIFSHALNKPCVFVAPQSEEPIFKYRDYFLSIGMEMPEPIKNIHSLNFNKDVQTNLSKVFSSSDFYFPTKEELDSSDIIS
ncbi:GumL protein [Nonlabens ulvanivorans]|uniref:GumL protein n=1 Tax=Nonlabens ulvanivorans TaxID=906888 RepID=A0A090X2W1_NONUL|nr:polysaccharide pyruvyl transferase family protein [Nonlabens ulvanivorans]GAL74972.1 GumL protein [Nonlabens ulvanivorans]